MVTDIALDGARRGFVAVLWRRTGVSKLYRWGLNGSEYGARRSRMTETRIRSSAATPRLTNYA